MRKILILSLIVLVVTACGSSDGSENPTINTPLFLTVGDTDQEGVDYFDDITSISFSQTDAIGDSTFYEATLDVTQDNIVDLRFNLVQWANSQVLTVTGTNVTIPFSGTVFEIFGTDEVIDGTTFLTAGSQIDEAVSDYRANEEGFITNTNDGMVTTSAVLIAWNGTFYLPFKTITNEGWVGLSITAANRGGDITGMGIETIAIR